MVKAEIRSTIFQYAMNIDYYHKKAHQMRNANQWNNM